MVVFVVAKQMYHIYVNVLLPLLNEKF